MTIIDMGKVNPACQNVIINEGTKNEKKHEDGKHPFPHETCLLRVCTAGPAYGMS
jgi:hypothetical protein